MTECPFCDREMRTAEGCIEATLVYEDGTEEPAPHHDVEGSPYTQSPTDRCHDCGAEPGGVHHPGCDWARDPRSDGQLLGRAAVFGRYGINDKGVFVYTGYNPDIDLLSFIDVQVPEGDDDDT